MTRKSSKLIGPFTVQIEINYGWKNNVVNSVAEAKQLASQTVEQWQNEGLVRVRDGANLFTDENFSTTKILRVFNAKDKLVTNEILAS